MKPHHTLAILLALTTTAIALHISRDFEEIDCR